MTESPTAFGRGRLSRDRIVDAAVELGQREGLDQVSMRRLGRELGVEPMSLYYHVPSKATLIVLMADRAVSTLPEPDRSRPWDERLVELLIGIYRAGIENPAVFPVLATEASSPHKLPAEPGEPPRALELITSVQDLLTESHLSAGARWHAYRGLIGLVVGLIVVQVDGLLPGPAPRPGQSAGDVPSSEAVMPPETADAVEDLRFSLQLFVDGLKRRT